MIIIMEQAIAQWWERSPPTNVARVQILASTPYVGWVCCWFSPLLREVFLQVPRRDPSPQKPTFSKFQFDQESGRRRTTLWMCYLQIIIIIYYYYYYYYDRPVKVVTVSQWHIYLKHWYLVAHFWGLIWLPRSGPVYLGIYIIQGWFGPTGWNDPQRGLE